MRTEGSFSTAPDKCICTVRNKVYKRQKNLEKHRMGCEKEKGWVILSASPGTCCLLSC